MFDWQLFDRILNLHTLQHRNLKIPSPCLLQLRPILLFLHIDTLYFPLLEWYLILKFLSSFTVCMGSTYEDDCEEGDDIILCDGCNAEAHLRCLCMTVVRSCIKCSHLLSINFSKWIVQLPVLIFISYAVNLIFLMEARPCHCNYYGQLASSISHFLASSLHLFMS